MKFHHTDVSKCGTFINALKYLHCFEVIILLSSTQLTLLFALYYKLLRNEISVPCVHCV
jgi:hypothetical protein